MVQSRIRLGASITVGLAIVVFGCFAALASDSSASDTPLELGKGTQGTCPKGQEATVRGCVTLPKLVKRVPPRYPDSERRNGSRGRVTLKVVIQADGKVGKVEVVPSPQTSGAFDKAAVDAVKQWKYEPAKLGSVPVAVVMTTVVMFSLE